MDHPSVLEDLVAMEDLTSEARRLIELLQWMQTHSSPPADRANLVAQVQDLAARAAEVQGRLLEHLRVEFECEAGEMRN